MRRAKTVGAAKSRSLTLLQLLRADQERARREFEARRRERERVRREAARRIEQAPQPPQPLELPERYASRIPEGVDWRSRTRALVALDLVQLNDDALICIANLLASIFPRP